MTLYLGKQQVAMTMNHVDESAVAQKVDKVTTPNIVYGTDSNGDQTTYDKNSFGQVDDVQVNGTSVVNNKVASITLGTMASENTTSYYTKTEVNGKLDDKQDTLVSGTNIKTVDGKSLLGSGNLDIDDLSNNITNCITEIPQDIKLELNNGTLTLKAGSKVYVPNGFEADGVTPKFDVKIVPSDVSFHTGTIGTGTGKLILCCNSSGGFGSRISMGDAASGSTSPGTGYHMWYDTANNLMKISNNGDDNWVSGYSLPVGIYQRTNGYATAIDQVFNGFGYIGSTVFALPGVKGLIPNGRNADGTLKNNEITISKVLLQSHTGSSYTYSLQIAGSSTMYGTIYRKYIEHVNYNWSTYSNAVAPDYTAGVYSTSDGKITSFTPKTAFHALDYNDSSTISGWSMPSSRYIDLTLGASGSTYTAPANGWVQLSLEIPANTWINIQTQTPFDGNVVQFSSQTSSQTWATVVPVVKNAIFSINYNNFPNTSVVWTRFRFIYAEGEN